VAYLKSENVDLYYQDQGNRSAKTTLLLSHGYAASSAMWQQQIEFLSDNYRIITWDMRGHGRSQSPDDINAYSSAISLLDMKNLLDACDVQSAVIGGHSLGGYFSILFNIKFPERVSGLMLFNTGPGFRNDKARDDWNLYALNQGQRFKTDGLEALRGRIETRLGHHTSAQGLMNAAEKMLTQHDASAIDSLPHIQVPTLIVCGEQDKGFLDPTAYMDKKIPSVTTALIPNARHAANLDQPELFNQALESYLARL